MNKRVPQAFYCCATIGCCDNTIYSAQDLWWCEELGDFYCAWCWENIPSLTHIKKGISLKDELTNRGLNR